MIWAKSVKKNFDAAFALYSLGCSYGHPTGCRAAAFFAVNLQRTDWQTARAFVEKGCASGQNESAGDACGYLGMMHWLGFLGGPIDHDLALSLIERGCELTNVQSCIWGSNISNMVEIADFEHSKTLAQRGCAMTRRSQFPEACVVLGDLFWLGDIHNLAGLSGDEIDFASALAPYDVACRYLILRACARYRFCFFLGRC